MGGWVTRWCLAVSLFVAACGGPKAPAPATEPAPSQPPVAEPEPAKPAGPCNLEADCEKRCKAKDVPSCTRLGYGLYVGLWTKPRPDDAVDVLLEACKAEDMFACGVYAVSAEATDGSWDGEENNPADLAERACDAGQWYGCYALYENYDGGPQQVDGAEENALRLAKRECDRDHVHACLFAADRAMQEAPVDDLDELFPDGFDILARDLKGACDGADMLVCREILDIDLDVDALVELQLYAASALCKFGSGPACEAGVEYADWLGRPDAELNHFVVRTCEVMGKDCVAAAQTYLNGTAADANKAVTLLEGYCERGDIEACDQLANLYDAGKHVARDLDKAFAYRKRACTDRVHRTCVVVAVAFIEGTHGAKNVPAGLSMLETACEEYDTGCAEVAAYYYEGTVTAADLARAAKYFEHACSAGNTEACVTYGVMLEHGSGVTKDTQRALEVYAGACTGLQRCGCVHYHTLKKRRHNKRDRVTDCTPLAKRGAKLKPAQLGTQFGTVGVPACDAYLAGVARCIPKMPPQGRPAMEKSLKMTVEAWRRIPASAHKNLEQACQAATVAAQKALAPFGCTF